jgi:hypothetical protein
MMYTTDMRTTLSLDEDVAERLAELQRQRGISFKDIVNQTLRKGLERDAAAAGARRPARFTVKARHMGQRPGLNFDNLGELLEQVEGARHR